jgi:hypothetical protein
VWRRRRCGTAPGRYKAEKRLKKPLQDSPFFIRLFNWEYWPFHLVYTPVYLWYLWLALKARHPLFFSAANPGIPTGGLVGESKRAILDFIPEHWKPQGTFVPTEMPETELREVLEKNNLSFPLVVKPDIGERGLLVRIVQNREELAQHRSAHPVDFVLQRYVSYPEEVSVLHFRMPGQPVGQISSVTLKRYLSVTGNGRDTLGQLVQQHPRALLQREELLRTHGHRWEKVPAQGELIRFHTIGNHSKGCMFLDGRSRISPALTQTFDRIQASLPGVFYCRYDIKCASWEALEQGRDFSILEINGVKSEPAHIYHPGYSIRRFYADIIWHWNTIYRISQANRQRGVPCMSLGEGWLRLGQWRRYHRRLSQAQTA